MLPLVAACLLFPSSLFSQEAKRLFVDMPDSLCQLLTTVNREDCIDFLEMFSDIENPDGVTVTIDELSIL